MTSVAAAAAGDPPRPLRLGFAGTPEFAIPALNALIHSGHQVRAVFTKRDRPAGRGRKLHRSPVKVRALELELSVHQPAGFEDPAACEALTHLDALVVVAYGLILPAAALAAPRLGCFNIHASLLPRWRGAAPIQRAILAGDRVTGVSIMQMEQGLDTGPVLASRELAIRPQHTAAALHDELAALGADLIRSTLDQVAADRAMPRAQSAEGITYAHKVEKDEALIDWRDDADRILRKVRAFDPTPVAETRLNGRQLKIWDASMGRTKGLCAAPGTVLGACDRGIEVACGRGTLSISRLQLAGRRPLPAAEFLRAGRLEGAILASP